MMENQTPPRKVENPALVIKEKQGTGQECIEEITCPHKQNGE